MLRRLWRFAACHAALRAGILTFDLLRPEWAWRNSTNVEYLLSTNVENYRKNLRMLLDSDINLLRLRSARWLVSLTVNPPDGIRAVIACALANGDDAAAVWALCRLWLGQIWAE
jgi:hypothetical protein